MTTERNHDQILHASYHVYIMCIKLIRLICMTTGLVKFGGQLVPINLKLAVTFDKLTKTAIKYITPDGPS